MKAVVQRVLEARVSVSGVSIAAIHSGMLILLGVAETDEKADADWLVAKIANLRIFKDENGVMNTSLIDVDGQALVVSQFTLQASVKKGNRPSYIRAAKPDKAIPLYSYFVEQLEIALSKKIPTGQFGADMQVSLVNDGPVTILFDTEYKN